MKIAVYSGSFNPMHIGHIAVIGYILNHGGFDMVYVIPSPHNPFKDGSIRDNARERYAAAVQAISRRGLSQRVKVDDIEFGMPVPSYSVDTLDALSARESDNSFTLVIGGDNVCEMLRWKEGARLISEYGIVVYPREGYDAETAAEGLLEQVPAARIQILRGAPFVTVSSTQIRDMLARGEDVSLLLA